MTEEALPGSCRRSGLASPTQGQQEAEPEPDAIEGRLVQGRRPGSGRAVFWGLIFVIIWRMLLYFRNTQGIGDLLAGKLLGLALLTFMGILLLSNVITSLSTFFLSQDLELLMASSHRPPQALRGAGWRRPSSIPPGWWASWPCPSSWPTGSHTGPTRSSISWSSVVMVPFLVLPAVVGVAVTLILVNVFPARRTRDLLALIGLFTAAGIVALFRFLRPERLVRPEEFRDLVDFIAVLRTPVLGLASQRVGRRRPHVSSERVLRPVPSSPSPVYGCRLCGDGVLAAPAVLPDRVQPGSGGRTPGENTDPVPVGGEVLPGALVRTRTESGGQGYPGLLQGFHPVVPAPSPGRAGCCLRLQHQGPAPLHR